MHPAHTRNEVLLRKALDSGFPSSLSQLAQAVKVMEHIAQLVRQLLGVAALNHPPVRGIEGAPHGCQFRISGSARPLGHPVKIPVCATDALAGTRTAAF